MVHKSEATIGINVVHELEQQLG